MAEKAAIYLAHLNPLTNSHETIISNLQREDYHVYVFPVRFLKQEREVNKRSFPFSYELRKEMVDSIFGNSVTVLPTYAFRAPYAKYLPPLISSRSWELRDQITSQIKEERFVSYTGDSVERLMLRIYGLKPLKARRLDISASTVKELLYQDALGSSSDHWRNKVPSPVAEIIKKNWDIVKKFAPLDDSTKRVMGMKFPREGYR